MKRIGLFVIIALMTGLTNCSTDAVVCTKTVDQAKLDAVPKNQLAVDIGRISQFLAAGSVTAVEDVSGLRYVVTKLGTGQTPCLSNSVTVNYSGKVLQSSNTQLAAANFDASTAATTFGLSGLILGWQVAFPKFPAGTTATLYVPSGLAYGTSSPSTKIPANSVLVFQVELVSFQ
jgi:FKBP-type peptidyl-prolyl cis-trans isomerase FkpA